MRRSTVTIMLLGLLVISTFGIAGCGASDEAEHGVVESGTYTGTITEVKPDEDEIYVEANGKELELYFIEETELTRDGQEVPFSTLESGQEVTLEIEKVGKRLDPLSVQINQ